MTGSQEQFENIFFSVLTNRSVFEEKNAKGLSSAPTLPNFEEKHRTPYSTTGTCQIRKGRGGLLFFFRFSSNFVTYVI